MPWIILRKLVVMYIEKFRPRKPIAIKLFSLFCPDQNDFPSVVKLLPSFDNLPCMRPDIK